MFENEIGLWALASLIPFIILYMIKPKPMDKIIPSLMFLLNNNKKSNRNSFLRKFIHNFLFLIQLIIIILLSLSVAAPYITAPYDITSENTVIIIDSSASMQAGNRFNRAIEEAKRALSGRNSIILAENIPLIVLEEGNIDEALNILGKLKAKATSTNLGDAMLNAKNDILKDKPGRIVVISDFSNIDGPDLEVVKKRLIEDDIAIDFIDVSDDTQNTGIIKMDISKYAMKVYVKNFKDSEETVTLKLIQDNKEISSSNQIKILPKSIETFIFDDVPAGISKVILEPKDDFQLDNTLYISTPLKKQIDVLLITNEPGSNLQLALEASKDINLNVVDLYKSPAMNFNTEDENIDPYSNDIIIVHKINKPGERGGMLLSAFSDIKEYIKKGGKVIFTAHPDSKEADLNTILEEIKLVKLYDRKNNADKVCVDMINEFTRHFENDICFSSIASYFNSEAMEDTITVASTSSKIPIIVLKDYGEGKAAYYGIFDDLAEFKTLPSYPIFWNKLINSMVETEAVTEFNYKAGKILNIPLQKIKTPSGTVEASTIIFDETGIYELEDKKIAINLVDEEESNLVATKIEKEERKDTILTKESKEHNFPIAPLLLLFVLILLFIETLYIKIRGDV